MRVPRCRGTGHGVRVGVIDSGWDRSVADGRVAAGVGLVDQRDELALAWSGDDHDRNGHGTAVAGLVLEVAPEAIIVPIRIFGTRLETSPDVLIAAITWAEQHNLRLLNLSLGTLRPDAAVPLYHACERARRAGVVIVATAANTEEETSYPAAFEPVIGVGHAPGVGAHDVVYRPGHAFECGAGAGARRIRVLGGGAALATGTSFAAPIVTGHIARCFARHGPLSVSEVRERLRSGCC